MTPDGIERRSDCPISFALDVFGDRWTLLVVRDLALKGKRTYSELLASDEGIATNILADRLKRLEELGIVVKRRHPDDGRQRLYGLTDAGLDLLPVLVDLIVWSATHDPQSAAPAAFVEEARRDRDGLLARLRGER
ncbi:MAG: helix-turn-helix transcriptional regulator [Myxococcales bacterium]|nr:helix-turn-helix transcriptional regulator [Myxococcales bacterium]